MHNSRDGLNRAAFIKRAGGAVFVLSGASGLMGLVGCGDDDDGGGGSSSDVSVTMFSWVGSGQDVTPAEIRDKYLADNPGVKIEMLQGTNAEMYPKIVASRQVDPNEPIVNFGFFNVSTIIQGSVDDMWLRLDEQAIPNLASVLPDYRLPEDKGVYFASSPIGLMYNKKIFEEKGFDPPTSWADLWKPEFKGRVALWDAPGWSYNGLVQTAKMNGGSETDMEAGFKIYEEAAKSGQIQSLYTTPTQVQQLLVSGAAWITPFLFSIMQPWVDEGAPLEYVVPSEGQIAFPFGFAMVTGTTAEQQKVASEVIDMMLAPSHIQRWCELTYTVPLVEGISFDAERQKLPAYVPENVENQILLDWQSLAEKNDEWTKQWNTRVKAHLS